MSTLDEIAAQVSAVLDRLDNANTSMTACGETLDTVIAVLTAAGVRTRAEAGTTARHEVDRILAMLAQLCDGAEQLRQNVLALKHGPTGTSPAPAPVSRLQPQAPPPVTAPDPGDRQRIEQIAHRADDVLVTGGINPADVYGKAPPDTPHRLGLARSLLDNAFPKKVRGRLLPWALRFAADRQPGACPTRPPSPAATSTPRRSSATRSGGPPGTWSGDRYVSAAVKAWTASPPTAPRAVTCTSNSTATFRR